MIHVFLEEGYETMGVYLGDSITSIDLFSLVFLRITHIFPTEAALGGI